MSLQRALDGLSLALFVNLFATVYPVVGVGGPIHFRAVSPPTVEVYEINRQNVDTFSYTRAHKSLQLVNVTRNSELYFGEATAQDSALLLKCNAPYAVQWVFRGDSTPEFNTNTSRVDSQDGSTFNAYLLLGSRRNLNERETGKYICSSVRNKRMQSYVYIFVTRAAIFTNKGSETVHYTSNDDSIRIPCSLSEPRATAVLQKKSQEGVLQCPMNDSVRFDPKQGFLLDSKRLANPEGTYICIADYNNTFQIIKYNVAKEEVNPDDYLDPDAMMIKPTQRPPSQATTTRPVASPPPGGSNSNCASVTCGENASCIRNTKSDAVCKCNEGFIGNPYIACKHKSLTTTPPPASSSDEFTNEACSRNGDCPSSQACIKNTCQDPCTVDSLCGTNTYCNETVGHVPLCKCREGFVGDPYSTQEGQQCEHPRCKPNVCGENTNCNYVNGIISCACKPGYVTHHDGVCRPNQQKIKYPHPKPTVSGAKPAGIASSPSRPWAKKECHYDVDCPDNRMCVQDKCEDPCVNACGSNAQCLTRNHFPRCQCPEGTSGDPFYRCTVVSPSSLQPAQPSSILGNNNGDEVVDCGGKNSVCGPNTICQATRKYFVCACPNFYTGDPYSKEGCLRENGYEKCQRDSDCPHFLTCLRHQGCVNPCNVRNVCQPGRSCVPYNHRPACLKTANYDVERPRDDLAAAGNNVELELTDVPDGMNSSNCFVKSGDNLITPCGSNAYCYELNDEAYCGCIANYVGDPYMGCEPLQTCKNKKGCPVNETCQIGYCIPDSGSNSSNPCSPSPCADPADLCLIIRANNSASCVGGTQLKSSLFEPSSSELQHRLGSACVDETCGEVGEEVGVENDENENYITTEQAYFTGIPTTTSSFTTSSVASMEDISNPEVDRSAGRRISINTSNESRQMLREELSVVDA